MGKIIAEICQNHNGDRSLLEEMVKSAAESGADMVKIQSIWSDDVTLRPRFEEGQFDEAGVPQVIKRPYQAEKNRLAKLDLTLEDHQHFIDLCQKYNVIPLTTIFARHRIPQVAALNWPERWIKVASYDAASYSMLRELAEHFDNFIISTGASYDEEIKQTAALMKSLGKNFVFLHCVTSYPNTLQMCNLTRQEWLRQHTDTVGWSDHTKIVDDGIIASKIALYLGANFVERHFTILESDQTKDGPVSITPTLLKELADFRHLSKEEQLAHIESVLPDWKVALGESTRDMTPVELLNRDYYRGRFASPKANQKTAHEDEWVYNWD